MSVRDGAVRLIFAGWLPQDGLFGWSASAGLEDRAWLRRVNLVAAHGQIADRSSRGRLLVVLVRLLWGFGWTKTLMLTARSPRAKEGLS